MAARVAGGDAPVALRIDLHRAGLAPGAAEEARALVVAGLAAELQLVTAGFESASGGRLQAGGLDVDHVGEEIVVDARRADGAIDAHAVVHQVADGLHDRGRNGGAARRADGELELARRTE